jgi:hypothetical protein
MHMAGWKDATEPLRDTGRCLLQEREALHPKDGGASSSILPAEQRGDR